MEASETAMETQPQQQESQRRELSEAELRSFFLREAKFVEHLDLQKHETERYKRVLNFLLEGGVELSTASKARILGCSWLRKDIELADQLVKRGPNAKTNKFGLPEILRALELLDSGRRIRLLEKKLVRYDYEGTAKTATIGKVKSQINDLKQDEAPGGSVNSGLARWVCKWVGTIPAETLQYYALSYPKEPWQKLADIVHLNPKHFQEPWFLDFVFNKPIPVDNIVSECANWRNEDETKKLELIKKWKLPFSFIRREMQADSSVVLTPEMKLAIAEYENATTIVWWYEELHTPAVDALLRDRLREHADDLLDLPYGKLVERLLLMREKGSPCYESLVPVAERLLSAFALRLEPPVVVMGDASGSMEVAIKTAAIVSSVVAAASSADLRFFNTACKTPSVVPRTIHDVLRVAAETRAGGGTANAAALWPSYENREVVNYFVMVTDEQENASFKTHRFAALYRKYLDEVNGNAKLIFVSFLSSTNARGQMCAELVRDRIPFMQFKFDGHRPDLTKLDTLLALLSSSDIKFENSNEDDDNKKNCT